MKQLKIGQGVAECDKKAAEWSSGRAPACCAGGGGSNPGWGAQEFSIPSFISRNSAACRSHAT